MRHKGGTHDMMVLERYENRVVLVRVAEATNPDEWDLVYKATHILQKPK